MNQSLRATGMTFCLVAVFLFVVHAAEPGTVMKGYATPEVKFPFLVTSTQMMVAAECREKALAFEKTGHLAEALTAWERVIDRCQATDEQLAEARIHIKALRPNVSRNTDPAKATPWKLLVIIFRHLDFSWTDKAGKEIHVKKTISAENEEKIRSSVKAFGQHIFHLSSGMLRCDTEIQVVDKPVTNLAGKAHGPFSPSPWVLLPLMKPLIQEKQYDTIMVYVKYNGDEGPAVPAPYAAATYGSIREVGGSGFIMVPWHTNYPFPGEVNGEMELHEWLHQVDWMFSHVLHYPDKIVPSSDEGRMEGDYNPAKDLEHARRKDETNWMRFYVHIMEDHITRQMWHEARMFPMKKNNNNHQK